MAQIIARAVAQPIQLRLEAVGDAARFAIVAGSAVALIMAGPALPLF